MIATPTAVEVPLRIEDGIIRIGKTRVTLDAVIADHHRGSSPEVIAQHYSALSASDVYLVIGYYLQHQAEVDAYIDDQERQAEEARREYEAAHPDDGLMERFRAAKQSRQNLSS
jgi:uncharacterized protein (DUF433 family)